MPGTRFDDVVSNDGTALLSSGGNEVLYVAFDLTTVLTRAQHNPYGITDQISRIGWFSLGDAFDIGDGTQEFWQPIEWWNFTRNLWVPSPTGVAGSINAVQLATRIRWFVFPGGEGHLHVFG